MSDPVRGITCPDKRRVVREALKAGWVWLGVDGGTHARILWPKTGVELRFGLTPGVASWKSTARDIKRISGVEVWRKGNRKRSHKSTAIKVDPQVAASRRKHAAAQEAANAARENKERTNLARQAAARASAEDDRRRREIEYLMR